VDVDLDNVREINYNTEVMKDGIGGELGKYFNYNQLKH
jgi:hypothetical protein